MMPIAGMDAASRVVGVRLTPYWHPYSVVGRRYAVEIHHFWCGKRCSDTIRRCGYGLLNFLSFCGLHEGVVMMQERDLELALPALQQAFAIVESYEPDQRNPSRYMRQLRRVLRNPDLQS